MSDSQTLITLYVQPTVEEKTEKTLSNAGEGAMVLSLDASVVEGSPPPLSRVGGSPTALLSSAELSISAFSSLDSGSELDDKGGSDL